MRTSITPLMLARREVHNASLLLVDDSATDAPGSIYTHTTYNKHTHVNVPIQLSTAE